MQSRNNETEVYKYRDEKEQIGRVNRFVLLGTTLVTLYMLVFTIGGIYLKTRSITINIIASILVLGTVLLDWYVFLKDRYDTEFKEICLGSFMIGYTFFTFLIHNSFMTIIVTAMLTGCIVYYDTAFIKKYSIILITIMLLGEISWIVRGSVLSLDRLGYLSVIGIFNYTIYSCAKVGKIFSEDTIGGILEDKKHQEEAAHQKLQIQEMQEIANQIRQLAVQTKECREKMHSIGAEISAQAGADSKTVPLRSDYVAETDSTYEALNHIIRLTDKLEKHIEQ